MRWLDRLLADGRQERLDRVARETEDALKRADEVREKVAAAVSVWARANQKPDEDGQGQQ